MACPERGFCSKSKIERRIAVSFSWERPHTMDYYGPLILLVGVVLPIALLLFLIFLL